MSVCHYRSNWFNSWIIPAVSCWHKDRSYCIMIIDESVFVPSGTRNAILNTEARTVEAEVLSRRCVIMRLADFSYEEYQKALRQSAGAVVIILPKNMSAVPQDIVQVIMTQCCRSLSCSGDALCIWRWDLQIYSTRRKIHRVFMHVASQE